MEDLLQGATILKAVADEKRLHIINLLKGGEKCACVLLEDLELSQSGLSYHMKILAESGLVTARQEGKWTHYTICEEGRQKLITLLDQLTKPTS